MVACQCPVCLSTSKKDNRLRSSVLVQSANTSLVVDTTPDFRYQMLREKVTKLDAVLFTHPHKDHIAGLDDIKAFTFLSGNPMEVYANTITQEALRREFYYIFTDNKYPGIPEINLNTISLEPFVVGDIPVIPILVWHLNMPVLAFRFGNFTYITDANRIEDTEKEKIKGSDTMVLNALRHKKHISHFTLSEAIELTQELKVPNAYYTHISHQLGKYEEINPELPEGIALAYDGLQLSFN
jgi:phosphoribosyl 1,2-cyclic phosphate phosphodiesterase